MYPPAPRISSHPTDEREKERTRATHRSTPNRARNHIIKVVDSDDVELLIGALREDLGELRVGALGHAKVGPAPVGENVDRKSVV